jgi:hypothetical protein
MNTPSEPEPPFEQQLKAAGRADAMSAASRQQILQGLGVVVPPPDRALTQLTRASAFKAPLAGLGAGALGALSLFAVAQIWQPSSNPTLPSAASHAAAPVEVVAPTPVPLPSAVATVAAAPPEVHAPRVAPSANPVTTKAPAPSRGGRVVGDSLNRELAKVDSARGALQRGESTTALRLLDQYNAEFPKGALRTEAHVLRIEALIASGDRATAVRLGKSFLARSPNGTYARRVRALTQQP